MKGFTPLRKLNLGQIITFFNQGDTRPKDKDTCKGNISVKECLDTLKVMGDGKSPGMDGFTAES